MKELLNWENKEWMAFFHKHRDLYKPVASEWKRLEQEYLQAKATE